MSLRFKTAARLNVFLFLALRASYRDLFEMLTAVVFPGQGSQRTGMGQDFYDEFPVAQQVFETAAAASGLKIKELCFEENEDLNLTEFTQPCILTCEVAMLAAIQEKFSLKPALFGGHSLGEYTALVAAGVLPLEAAVQIVRKRGALMQAAVPEGKGAMSALKLAGILENNKVRETVEAAGAEIANINSPDQLVISGASQAVKKAGEDLSGHFSEIEVIPLAVSAPFHSKMMQPIEDEFRKTLESFQSDFTAVKSTQVLSNYTGDFHSPDQLVDNLVKQISASVRWTDNMRTLLAQQPDILEIGPNRPLGGFFRATGNEIKSIINMRSAEKAFKNA